MFRFFIEKNIATGGRNCGFCSNKTLHLCSKSISYNYGCQTIESKAFKELEAKINAIADYILNKQESEDINEDEIWVDSYEVCTFLKISDKTLQRLRVSGTIAYSNIRGRYFYKIGEIKRMLEERLIKSNSECLNDLVTNHKLYVKERRNLRKNK